MSSRTTKEDYIMLAIVLISVIVVMIGG